jgi:hypothetical protein
MPKFQISGYSLDFSLQAAAFCISGNAYWSLSLSIFLIGFSSCAVSSRTTVQTFASGSPDSPRMASAA